VGDRTLLDRDGPVIVTAEGLPPDARFAIGSVTKTMTATLRGHHAPW
jgi:CubicO group peptidase (beta-lactamase class C family)